MHRASNTGRHLVTAADAAYNRIAIGIFSAYLPADRRAGDHEKGPKDVRFERDRDRA